MALKQIDIVRKKKDGKDVVGPQDSPHTKNNRTTVVRGDSVKFTLPPGAEKDSEIKFKGKSPFGGDVIYDTPMALAVDRGLFTYTCKIKIGMETLETDSGGEMEIIQT